MHVDIVLGQHGFDMKIVVNDFVEGAKAVRGIAVIIDVFRAFSLAAYAFDAGVSAIYPVADIDEAWQLKRERPERLLLGERDAQPVAGFDGGNSPAHLSRWNLTDREVIHTTHAGTQGLMNAINAEEVLTGALVNASAIVRYIKQRAPSEVTLVRMGYAARVRCLEDDICAEVLSARLQGNEYCTDSLVDCLRRAPAAAKFFDPKCQSYAPEQDFEMCAQLDHCNFILRLERDVRPWRLRRYDV